MLVKRALLTLVPAVCSLSCARHGGMALKPTAPVDRQVLNAVDAGDGDIQLSALRAQLDRNPRDLDTRLKLAERYRALGFPEIAIEHCRLACERTPDSEEAHIALAKMLRDVGRSTEASLALTRFSALHDGSARLWAWIGLLGDDSGDWKSGEQAYRKALTLDPDHDDLHNNLGYCLLRQGRTSEAAAEFENALRLNKSSVVARNNLGTALTGDPLQAVGHLQSVTDPASAHNNLAVAYIEAGRYADARREIEIALGYNRQHSAALLNLQLVSQLDEKPADFRLPVRPEGKWSRVHLAWRHFWGGDVPEARNSNQPGSAVASR